MATSKYYTIRVGDTVRVVVDGVVTERATGHGLSFKVKLPQEDFESSRSIWLNDDEVELTADGVERLLALEARAENKLAQLLAEPQTPNAAAYVKALRFVLGRMEV